MSNPTFRHDCEPHPAKRAIEASRNYFLPFIPHNPLKTLDSDEEIQGNPTRKRRDFGTESATSQENPNGSDARGINICYKYNIPAIKPMKAARPQGHRSAPSASSPSRRPPPRPPDLGGNDAGRP